MNERKQRQGYYARDQVIVLLSQVATRWRN